MAGDGSAGVGVGDAVRLTSGATKCSGVGVGDDVSVAVAFGVGTAVRVGVASGVDAFGVAAIDGDAVVAVVGVADRFFSGVDASVGLDWAVVGVGLPVGGEVAVAVGVEVGVPVAVWVGVAVAVGVSVGVAVGVGVGRSHRGGHSTNISVAVWPARASVILGPALNVPRRGS